MISFDNVAYFLKKPHLSQSERHLSFNQVYHPKLREETCGVGSRFAHVEGIRFPGTALSLRMGSAL